MFSKKKSLLLLLVVFTSKTALSQCAMCKAVVEANVASGDTKAAGLNDGILFLMSMPYIAVFLFALFFYLQKRKMQTT